MEPLQLVQQLLERLRIGQLKLDIAAKALTSGALVLAVTLTSGLVEAAFRFPAGDRLFLTLIAALIAATALVVLWAALIRDRRLTPGRASQEWWALRLGELLPRDAHDRLLNALQVAGAQPRPQDDFSAELAIHSLKLALTGLDEQVAQSSLDRQPLRFGGRLFAIVGAAFLLSVLTAPTTLVGAADRLLRPFTEFDSPPEFTVQISPAGGWAYRGEPLEFSISAHGIPPREVQFSFRRQGGDVQREPIRLTGGEGLLTLAGQPESFYYRIEAGEYRTAEYLLTIISRPQIAKLQTRLKPPSYTRLPEVVGRENDGNVEALPGSKLQVQIEATKPLAAAQVRLSYDGLDSAFADTVAMSVKGSQAQAELTVKKAAAYYIALYDKDGHPDKNPVVYRMKTLTDERPTARILFPPEDVEIGDDLKLPLEAEAADDFGISRMQLAFRNLSRDSTASALPLPMVGTIGESATSRTVWNMTALDLLPGDVLEYWIQAWDTDAFGGPKLGESERRLVRLPSIEEIVARAEQTEKAGMEETKAALDAAKELRDDVQKLVEALKRNPELSWEKQRQVEQAMERQNELEKKLESAAQKLDELVNNLDRHDLASAETLEKYRQLQELIAEVASDELKEAMEKLKLALESQDPEKVRQALNEFDMNREQFLQSIEKTMNILRQLQLERRMDELALEAERLLREQEAVLRDLDSLALGEAATREQTLAQATERMKAKLNQTAELARQQEEGQLADRLDSLALNLDRQGTISSMKQAAESMKAGDKASARPNMAKAGRELAGLWASLSQASQELKDRRKDELATALRLAVEQLLYLSRDQEELTELSKRLGTGSPRYRELAGLQGDIQRALQALTQNLFELSKETFFITPNLSAELGRADESMAQAIEGYTSRNPRTVQSPQEQSLGGINRAAGKLIEILGELEGASSASGYEEMMQKLSEMASAQQGLNQQSLPMPGEGGQSQMPGGEQLSRLAAQQRALQQQMGELAGESEGMSEVLGDLEGIAASMGEVAKDLEEKNVDERTRRLQQQIVTRLLDATKSVRQEQLSRQRESYTGRDLLRRSPSDIDLERTRSQLRRDLLRALQEGYTRDYKALIRAYFQHLEQQQPQAQP